MIGSLLRFPHEAVMERMLAALAAHGFDISATELLVLLYPGPDGRRPTDLARQCNMTRQAMNYVLAGLEQRGYIAREDGGGTARVVRLTRRGWATIPVIRGCVAGIETEWSAHLGAARFKALSGTLRELSRWLGKLP
ncbi:MAG: MarR family transcriptional regulator [Burkholderiales bacterium]|nr:MarR family transcriptional regulator [Burkholderiales bacterium]